MLLSEKQATKTLPKVSAIHEFDLNEGIVTVSTTTTKTNITGSKANGTTVNNQISNKVGPGSLE
jgi:hypothetical protein